MIIGVGIDLVDVEQFRVRLERTPSLTTRLFTVDEAAYAAEANDGALRLAARFAAKEAFLKALGVGLGACKFTEIEVVRAASGAPSLALHGGAAELCAQHGVGSWQLSLTHTALSAGAVAVALP